MNTWKMAALLLLGCACVAAPVRSEELMAPHLSRWSEALRDGEVVIPPEWAGIWEIESTTYDCETEAVLFNSTFLDTVCTGSVVQNPGTAFDITCTGSADGATVTNHCEGSFELLPGCAAEFTYDTVTTRTGETFVSTSTSRTHYAGECFGTPDGCNRIEQTATRIAAEPAPCEITPTETSSWGTIKSHFLRPL